MTGLAAHLAAHLRGRPTGVPTWAARCICGWQGQDIESTPAHVEHVAHVAATWAEHRTVRTVEELDALPAGTIIREINIGALRKDLYGEWHSDGSRNPWTPHQIICQDGDSARILWHPEEDQ